MAMRIEDYALIGDRRSGAIVGSDGSIDWMCLPRFDSAACFAALLGTPEHGRWLVAPEGSSRPAGRRYREGSMVLETDLTGAEGTIRVTDCMPVHSPVPEVVRLVTGLQGQVHVESNLRVAFEYGSVVPLWRRHGRSLEALAGPDALVVDGDVRHELVDGSASAHFHVGEGETVAFRLAARAVGEPLPARHDLHRAVADTDRWWRRWSQQCTYEGPYQEAVVRSLLTLKALTYAPSGGIVAAVTTSLPELVGGPRNWDYRYCWIRDATFTLLALLDAGYVKEATDWRDWLLRALGGTPAHLQIMYGVAGERRLRETELDLPGYAGSRPVRIGNAASTQFQLDVYGELMDCLHQAREHDIPSEDAVWHAQVQLLEVLEGNWQQPDNGIWEVRGPRRDFVESKVMAWAAVDRAVQGVERRGLPGPLDRWRGLRTQIHDEVCQKGYDSDRGTFTQYYGSKTLDASLLQLAPVGFLPASDARIQGTVRAIEQDLLQDGVVQRYDFPKGASSVDGLPPGEGAFLPCTFWLADNHALAGDTDRATEIYERLLDLRNDVGLLSEEYDVGAARMVGNLPQAFSHVPLINTAFTLLNTGRGAQQRASSSTGRTS